MTDENKPVPPTPPAGTDAAQPSALSNLAALQAEEHDDDAITSELDAHAKEEASLLTLEQRKAAAEKGALMAVGLVETLLGIGMKVGGVDEAVRIKVKAEVDKEKAAILKDMAPILLKYGAEPPAVVANVIHEIMLAFKLLMLGVSIYVAIRDSKKKPEAANDESQSKEMVAA